MKEILAARESKLRDQEEALQVQQAEQGQLRAELEAQSQQTEACLRRAQQSDAQLAQMRAALEKFEAREADASAELANAQQQCVGLEQRVGAMREEILELRRRLSVKNAEVRVNPGIYADDDFLSLSAAADSELAIVAHVAACRYRLRVCRWGAPLKI